MLLKYMTLFRDISFLLTLSAAARKGGRKVIEADLGLEKNQSLIEEKGRIVWIGPTSKIPKKLKVKKEISLKNKTVLPAFVECHTHTVFAGSRSHEFELRQQGLSYQEIAERGGGIISTVGATRKSKSSELLELAIKRAENFMAQGVTTLESKSGYGLDWPTEKKILEVSKRLVKETGLRVVPTYLGPHAIPKGQTPESYLESCIEDLKNLEKTGLACRGDIFIEKGYFSIEQGRKYAKALKKLNMDVVIHADQITRTGAAQLAVEVGARSADHLIQINDDDVKSLAQSEVACVLLPAADLYLKMSYPPARKLIEAGAKVALATDYNPGSSPTQDLALVGLLARLEMKMSLPEVISAYTVGAAEALGLSADLGSLDVGKFADFVILERDWTDLFYSAGDMGVTESYSQGRRLFKKS